MLSGPDPAQGLVLNPDSSFRAGVYAIVRGIPAGRVMSYGQIARCIGRPRAARQVGYALAGCPDGIPWQRVINAQGRVSPRADSDAARWQRLLLEAEGVVFDGAGRVSFERYGFTLGESSGPGR